MKEKIKKILAFAFTFSILLSCFIFKTSAEGVSLRFNPKSPAINTEFVVSVSITTNGGIDTMQYSLNYNQGILEFKPEESFKDCSGGAGILNIATDNTGTHTFKFKAIKNGAGNVSVSNCWIVKSGENKKTEVVGQSANMTVTDAAKPGVATLKSLSLSEGTLSPAFSSGRTSYTAKVKYEVTSCKVFATATDAKATVAVGGKEALAVGKNTRTVTVTAQNGTQKTYTIVITRLKEGEELDGETKPEDNTDEPEKSTVIDGVKYLLATDLSGFTLPNGFKANTVTYGETEVAAAQDTDANYTVYYLKGENSESYQPYTLESDGKTFKKLKFATFGNNTYIFADIPEGKTVPEGFYQSSVKIGDFDIPAYKSPDEGLTDFYYTYCFFEKNFAMYRYDSRENVLQRCPEFTLGDISAAAPKGAGFAARFASLSSNAKIIVVGIVILIIAAVALIVMLIVRMVKPHYDDDDGYDDDMFTNAFDSVTVEDGSEPKKETEEKTK